MAIIIETYQKHACANNLKTEAKTPAMIAPYPHPRPLDRIDFEEYLLSGIYPFLYWIIWSKPANGTSSHPRTLKLRAVLEERNHDTLDNLPIKPGRGVRPLLRLVPHHQALLRQGKLAGEGGEDFRVVWESRSPARLAGEFKESSSRGASEDNRVEIKKGLAVLLIKSLEQTHKAQADHHPLRFIYFIPWNANPLITTQRVSFTLDEVYAITAEFHF